MVCYNYNYISLQHASPKLSYNMALSSSPCLTTKPSLGSLAFPMVIILYGLQVGCLFDYLTARIPLPLVSLHSISLPPTHLKNTWIVLSFLSSLLLISACVHSHLSLFLPVWPCQFIAWLCFQLHAVTYAPFFLDACCQSQGEIIDLFCALTEYHLVNPTELPIRR